MTSAPAETAYLSKLKSRMGGGGAFVQKTSSFKQIFEQLRDLVSKAPEIEERLTQRRLGQSEIVLTTDRRTSGLRLKQDAWASFLAHWKSDLELKSESIIMLSDDGARAQIIFTTLEAAALKVRSARERASGKSRANRSKEAQAVYGEILNDPKFIAASAFLVREFLEQPSTEAWFTSDADILQTRFASLRAGTDLNIEGIDIPPEIQPLIGRKTIPELKLPKLESKDESELFSVATYVSEKGEVLPIGKGPAHLKLVPVTQRIDSIWKGIFSSECVGGDPKSFRSLTPERWAAPLLNDSMFFNVTLSDRYVGFVQVVPVEIRGKVYGSIEMGSDALSGFALSTDGLEKKTISSIVFSEIKSRSPTNWSGLLIGESLAMASAPGMRTSWSTPEFLFGETIGTQSDARINDPLANAIISASPKKGFAKRYGGKMITDATIADAGKLFRLSDENVAVLKARLMDPKYLFPILDESSAKLTGATDYFKRQPLTTAERAALTEALLKAVELKQIRTETALRFMPTLHLDPASFGVFNNPRLAIAYRKMQISDRAKRARGEFTNRLWNLHARI